MYIQQHIMARNPPDAFKLMQLSGLILEKNDVGYIAYRHHLPLWPLCHRQISPSFSSDQASHVYLFVPFPLTSCGGYGPLQRCPIAKALRSGFLHKLRLRSRCHYDRVFEGGRKRLRGRTPLSIHGDAEH